MATKMLAASLQAVAGEGKKALTCVILNPKAMQIEQLYGHFEKDEWKVCTVKLVLRKTHHFMFFAL